jgi:hypothetical protein
MRTGIRLAIAAAGVERGDGLLIREQSGGVGGADGRAEFGTT